MKNSRKPKIIICDSIAEIGIKMLQDYAEIDIKTELRHDELLKVIHEYDAIVVRGATKITRDVIEHGSVLKAIARVGSGLDNIDVVAAQGKGIRVLNSPDANTIAVAEHTMGLLLALARRLSRADMGLKRGIWEKKELLGTGLVGKTLGIIGFGRIGREVAIRAQAFGMKILVNQRRPTPELNLEAGVMAVDLNILLKQSDFVTLHIPSTPDNKYMFGENQLALMKKTAFLINTARGDIIDETALLKAINEGRLMGAALDVFSVEPVGYNLLVQHEKVIATPHIGSSTEDAQIEAAITIADKLIEFFDDIELDSVLPLKIVPLDLVFPHEHFDRRRAERLANRIEKEKHLLNPPVVLQGEKGFMVLDGATRVAALKMLNYPHIIVQLINSENGLSLHTWYHVIRDISVRDLITLVKGISEIHIEKVEITSASDFLFEYGGLCFFQTVDGNAFLVYPSPGSNRLEALNSFTNEYIEAGRVSRTLNNNIIELKHEFPDLTALVIFPEYTVSQVMNTAQSGKMFPAGITRFVIPGRILRVKADLNVLRSELSLRKKNRWLHDMLIEKQSQGKIRYYEEPVYILDD